MVAAPGKRSATTQAADNASRNAAAKVARRIEKAPQDPFEEECETILTLLDWSANLTDATKEMLRAAAPHALRTSKDHQRHEFEDKFVSALTELLNSIRASGQAAVEAANGQADEIAAERTRAEEAHAAAQAEVNARSNERELATAAVKAATSTKTAEKERTNQKLAEKASLNAKHDAQKQRLLEHSRLLEETWEPLRDGRAAGHWKLKEKMINGVLRALQGTDEGLDDALKDTLPVCLKSKPDERGAFAVKALDFAHEVLIAHKHTLQELISGQESETASINTAVDEANTALLAVEATLDNRMSELVSAEDNVSAAKDALQQADKATQSLKPKEKAVSDGLLKATAELEAIDGLIARFHGLHAAPLGA